jgi:putative DNA methylase
MTKTKVKSKSKKELLTEQIAAAVGAGREVAVETVDFSDPNRPKTCLEVDFPIIPINQIANVEGNAGKPIYQMSKWWARRRSSVFRSMLIAAAMKAPDDESQTAKAVWEVYYANHQKHGSFRHLKVADPFMGGGTTIVEGSRLGMQMFGCDLNPVAWFVVKNEMARVDIGEVQRLLAEIEAEVKPVIMPYYACDGPNGEKGKWFRREGTKESKSNPVQWDLVQGATPTRNNVEDSWTELPISFDIFCVPWEERKNYRYKGPEIIYTFWARHGQCQLEGCRHRTPIMVTPVVAIKTLTVDAWASHECSGCHKTFDVERHAVRMAPDSPLFIAPDERPFAVMDDKGRFTCPYCGKVKQEERALSANNSQELGKSKSKKVELTLLIHPQWLEGCPNSDELGREYGGSATDSIEASIRWYKARAPKVRLLEVRGTLPEQVTCPETKVTFYTDKRGGTVPKKSTFACAADGSPNDVLTAIKATNKTGPMAAYTIQGYSPAREKADQPYSGRFFAAASDARRYSEALNEWGERKDTDLQGFWPTSELPYGFMTHHLQGGVPNHGFTHWWKMFNPLQLLVHSQLLKAIADSSVAELAKEYVLGAFQQYLRNQNIFCIWDISRDGMAPHMSNNNYYPKNNAVENCVFANLGRGNWTSCTEGLLEGFAWAQQPWEPVVGSSLDNLPPETLTTVLGKSVKVKLPDKVSGEHTLVCASATELLGLKRESVDAVITDPPFGGLLHYSELSDFFYVWLRLALRKGYPDLFEAEYVPKALEAVANRARQPENANSFYQRILTDCWHEAHRVLKAGGILAFTFHHSEDEPWVGVLESLFDAGFYLEATYPIRSDETKGDGEFGSKTIEYDIIHVCRKRTAEPQLISWARLRRQITEDVRRLRTLLSQHQKEGLPAADLQVIKRGKALEYFSRHYGKVYIEQGREFTIREALLGINQLLDDDMGKTGGPEAPPPNAEPYTRQFFRLFYETIQVPRDQIQKFLRGTGIAPSDFEERGWCSEKNKVFTLTPPVELARAWKGASRRGMARDFDQTMFLVGGCVEGSGIRVTDTLDSPNFSPHPATAELVDWLTRHGGSQEIKFAAQRAQTIYRDWLGKNKPKAEEQRKLFDLEA